MIGGNECNGENNRDGDGRGAALLNREVRRGLFKNGGEEGRQADSRGNNHARQLEQDVQRPWGRWSSVGRLG